MRIKYDFDDRKKINNKKIIFVVLMLFIAVLLSSVFFRNSNNKIARNFSSTVLKPFVYVYDFSNSLFNNVSVKFSDKEKIVKENEELKNENENLKMKLLESQKVLDENESLKKMVEIKKTFQHFGIVMGNIIYREHDNWSKTFI